MQAIDVQEPGGPESLKVVSVAEPPITEHDVLIRVAAAGVNRADVLQRQGFYPPPRGASAILGLECSGTVVAVGSQVVQWQVGDEVCALLSGGGYAERVAVPQGQVMPIPEGVSLIHAAGLPEVAATVVSNLDMVARLRPDEWVLLHGGGSGIGTFAIQWAKAIGAKVAVTVGSQRKAERCRDLGADVAIDYRTQDFATEIRSATADHGADVILDIIGAKYLEANLRTLAVNGRLVVIGLQGGVRAELDLARLLTKRASISATSLRARPESEKAQICRTLVTEVWPLIAAGSITPVIDRVLPLHAAPEAHQLLTNGASFGKVLLTPNGEAGPSKSA
jgi:putative PIG3 family NAD(P)H quinone oxidoreductase